MKRKMFCLALSFVCLVVCTFAFGVRARWRESSPQTPDAPAAQNSEVAPAIVYRFLFEHVALLDEQAAEEEKQGRQGRPYRSLYQRKAALDESQARILTEVAAEYKSATRSLEAEARPLVDAYREPKQMSLPDKQAALDRLKALQERREAITFQARDKLRDKFGPAAFARFENFIQQNLTANIKTQEFSSTGNSAATKFPGRQRRAPADFTPTGPASPLTPEPAFGFCSEYSGLVFYLSALWVDPFGGAVFQYSATALDFCAGLYYDPYVFGELETPWGNVVAGAERRGYASFIPAQILMATGAAPNTQYAAYSEHWIVRRPCLFASESPGACWTPIDAFYFGFITPACLNAPVSPNPEPDFIPPCTPPPSPTPTPTPPTLKVEAVGFTGDIPLTHWDKTVAKRMKIDATDGTQPTWTRQRNPKFAAAYVRGTNPTMFASFSITPSLGMTGQTIKLQAKRGNNIIATKDMVSIGGQVTVTDIPVTGLEPQPVVKRGVYDFTWEISFDDGQTWRPAGKSDKHTIYWTYAVPLSLPFKTQSGQPCFQTAIGSECNTIYDEALKIGTENLGNGSDNLAAIVEQANKNTADRTYYDPGPDGVEPATEHPLIMLTLNKKRAQCSANANILRGVLNSLGIEAETFYLWGGDTVSGKAIYYRSYPQSSPNDRGVTFQVERDRSKEGIVEKNPHFSFHAVVRATNLPHLYDPSYGESQTGSVAKTQR